MLHSRRPSSSAAVDHRRRVIDAARLEQRARAVAAGREQPDLAQRLRLLGDLRLALAEQRGELADGQLLFGTQREQAQPILVSEETEQICTRGQHDDCIYSIIRMNARCKYMWQILNVRVRRLGAFDLPGRTPTIKRAQ